MSELRINELNDMQKTYLTQMSYLDVNEAGMEKIRSDGMTVSEMKQYLAEPEAAFCGTACLNQSGFDKTAGALLGDDHVPTNAELLQQLEDMGLGDLRITDIAADSQTGFQAMAFEDPTGNTGISYRGSDLDLGRGAIKDWLKADFLEYFTGDSEQAQQAMAFFDRNRNDNGQTFVCGHSLGGNLTSHVFAERHEEIGEAFTINGNPINQKALDTQEKIDAFNSSKYNCNMVCGDVVSNLKSFEAYQGNVHYIKNNDSMNPSLLSAHLVQSASLDENGNFVQSDQSEMRNRLGKLGDKCMGFIQGVREMLNDIENRAATLGDDFKQKFSQYKESFMSGLGEDLQHVLESRETERSKDKIVNIDELFNQPVSIDELFQDFDAGIQKIVGAIKIGFDRDDEEMDMSIVPDDAEEGLDLTIDH
jgi:hypothetical protein